ncbi:MAG: hypothetical protein AAFY98_02295 [Verrucomicrobiota bacterium]
MRSLSLSSAFLRSEGGAPGPGHLSALGVSSYWWEPSPDLPLSEAVAQANTEPVDGLCYHGASAQSRGGDPLASIKSELYQFSKLGVKRVRFILGKYGVAQSDDAYLKWARDQLYELVDLANGYQMDLVIPLGAGIVDSLEIAKALTNGRAKVSGLRWALTSHEHSESSLDPDLPIDFHIKLNAGGDLDPGWERLVSHYSAGDILLRPASVRQEIDENLIEDAIRKVQPWLS